MTNKRPYLFKSLLFLYVSLVLVSNFYGLLQQDQESPTAVSNDAFLESISKIDNGGDIGEMPNDRLSLVISFGLTDQLNAALRHRSSDSLAAGLSYLSYPLLGNDDTEKLRRKALLTEVENSRSTVLFLAEKEWSHLALELGSQTDNPNLRLLLLNPAPLPDTYLLGGYYLNNLFIQAYGLTLRILYHMLPHFNRLIHWKDKSEMIRLVSDYKLSQATQHGYELAQITKIIRTSTNVENRWVMNENQQVPLLDRFVHEFSTVATNTIYVERQHELPDTISVELLTLANTDLNESRKMSWDVSIVEKFKVENYVRVSGIYLALLMLLISLISLFSEDLACISAGVLASRGVLHLSNAILASALGVIVFDVFIYVLGRTFKRGWLEKMPLKWMITEKDLDYFTGWFSKNAAGVLWLSRFIPGSRFPAYFSAGLCRYPFFTFMLHFIASTLVWAPILGFLAYLLGQEMMNYYESYYGYIPQLILGLGFSLYVLFNWILPLTTPLGRRKIFRRWIRLKNLYSVK